MASQILYPAIINSYIPSFIVKPNTENSCIIKFSLSKFNASKDFKSVHISIKKQSTGENVVKTSTGSNPPVGIENHKTGIIINRTIEDDLSSADNNEYYIKISDSDIKTSGGDYTGWVPGVIYQIQLRLSEKICDSTDEAKWLNDNAGYFSEWSTLCVLKPISEPYITSSTIAVKENSTTEVVTTYNSKTSKNTDINTISGADFYGQYCKTLSSDNSELYSYQLTLSKGNTILEQSDIIYTSQYENRNDLKYTFKYDFEDSQNYKITVDTVETGDYNGHYDINVTYHTTIASTTSLGIYTAENGAYAQGYSTTAALEEDDGRVGIFIKGAETSSDASGEYIIRRTSSKSNFKIWEDVNTFKVTNISDVNYTFYDYAIESGVFYKYGVQLVDKTTKKNRGRLVVTTNPIIREFYFSYILGQNGKQLRLMFDNTMNSFKINVTDGIKKGIDGQYPFITRSGGSKYKTFPINGLISFEMDENNLFTTKEEIYGSSDIVALYEARNSTSSSNHYNYVYERDFREKVIEFLQDGKAKLFKSPTEGNVVVRITEVNCTPNDTLSRLIYSFSSTGTEICEYSMENLKKYKLV